MEKFIWRSCKMLGILKNKNIKSIETDVNDNGIKIEMKLKKSILEMSKFELYSAIYDFDDFIKGVLANDDKRDYLNSDYYEYELLTKDDKNDEELLFTILYNFILNYNNSTVNYNYYGYYNLMEKWLLLVTLMT